MKVKRVIPPDEEWELHTNLDKRFALANWAYNTAIGRFKCLTCDKVTAWYTSEWLADNFWTIYCWHCDTVGTYVPKFHAFPQVPYEDPGWVETIVNEPLCSGRHTLTAVDNGDGTFHFAQLVPPTAAQIKVAQTIKHFLSVMNYANPTAQIGKISE